MTSDITKQMIQKIPKTDIHLHLDGSLRLTTLIELAKSGKIELPSYNEQGLRETVFKEKYIDLSDYLKGFAYTCSVLHEVENIERVAFELAEDNLAEGVRYIEVRLAPQLHVNSTTTIKDIINAVAAGLEKAKKSHNKTEPVKSGVDLPFEYGVIICAMRSFNKHMGEYFADLLNTLNYMPKRELCSMASLEMARAAVDIRDETGLPIVGFDLAGEEEGFPAAYHSAAYHCAHSHFLGKTVHAGEAYGPESIFQAISQCHAERIGHGTFLFEPEMIDDRAIKDPECHIERLVEYIAKRRVTIEVCLTSNLQTTPSIRKIKDHPVKHMIDRNLAVSICTDNRLISNTTVSRELELLVHELPITKSQFKNIVMAGFKGTFFNGSYNQKRAYVRKAMTLVESILKD